MTESEIFTAKESAAYRKCSTRKQDRERAEGGGPTYVRIDGRIFYRRSDVDRFIEAHLCGGERATAELRQDDIGDDAASPSKSGWRLKHQEASRKRTRGTTGATA